MEEIARDVDLHRLKPFERTFPDLLTNFMTEVNFTESADDVIDLVVEYAASIGFDLVLYEYTHDIHAPDADLVVRTNMPAGMEKLESLMRPRQIEELSYGRRHCMVKWTPGVSGAAFTDMFPEYPDYQRKMKLSAIYPGVSIGFGVPVRSPNPGTRAGFGFGSHMEREACLAAVDKHGPSMVAIAWAAHIRVLQHERGEGGDAIALTIRQRRYVDLLAMGLLDKQIAHEMEISESGVRKFKNAVARKLGVSRRAEIVPAALKAGLLSESDLEPVARPRSIWSYLSWTRDGSYLNSQ